MSAEKTTSIIESRIHSSKTEKDFRRLSYGLFGVSLANVALGLLPVEKDDWSKPISYGLAMGAAIGVKYCHDRTEGLRVSSRTGSYEPDEVGTGTENPLAA